MADALDRYPAPGPGTEWPITRVRRVTAGALEFTERTRLLRADLDAL